LNIHSLKNIVNMLDALGSIDEVNKLFGDNNIGCAMTPIREACTPLRLCHLVNFRTAPSLRFSTSWCVDRTCIVLLYTTGQGST
jgi:hypothetical protein